MTGLTALLLSPAALAGSWYGDITYTGSDGNLPDSAIAKVDNSDTGWQLSAGYDVNQYFAVEVGYVDFGKQSSRLNGALIAVSPGLRGFNPFSLPVNFPLGATQATVLPAPALPGFTAETTGIRLASIGKLSLSPSVNLNFQAGALVPRYKTTQQFFSYDFQVGGMISNLRLQNRTEGSNEPEVFLGMGVHWAVNLTVGIKVFWEKLNDLGNESTIEQDVDTYNLTLRYQF
jgi:hypothetical protein